MAQNLTGILAGIPGLRGWQAQDQFRQNMQQGDQATQINQMKLAQIFEQAQEQKKMQEIARMSGGDPVKAQQLFLEAGMIDPAAKAYGMIPKTGSPERTPDFAQLINIRDAYAAKGDTRNAGLIDAQIRKMNEGIPKTTGETPADKLARDKFEWEKSHYGQEKPMTLPQRQKFEGAKAKDTAAVQIADRTTNTLIDEIDKLIGNEEAGRPEHEGLKGSVGYIDAMLPPVSKSQADAQALIKGLLAKTSVAGLQDIRQSGSAPGSITEKEWPIFQNYIKTIDPKQSHPQFVQQLKELRQMAKEFQMSAHNNFDARYSGDTQQPTQPIQPKRIKFDAQGNPM